MNHIILCNNYRQAVITSNMFANHYAEKGGVNIVKRQTEVKVGDNLFIFVNRQDPRTAKGLHGGFVKVEDFIKKYFDTPK